MSFKKCSLVILPTNERIDVGSIVTRPSDNRMAIVNVLTKDDPQPCVHQYLYILSDEEIKEGDWYITSDNKLLQCRKVLMKLIYTYGDYGRNPNGCRKVICTTDKSLVMKFDIIGGFETGLCLPQPPQSFIEYFVHEYNKGNVVSEVEVEYEQIHWKGTKLSYEDKFNLKINPKDNTITINKLKDMYSREELEYLLHRVVNESHCGFDRIKHANSNECAGFVNKWIETNL